MPGPIHLPDFSQPIVCHGTMTVEFTPFGHSLSHAMSAIEKARESSVAATGWTSREHDGVTPPPRDDGPKWVGKGRRKR